MKVQTASLSKTWRGWRGKRAMCVVNGGGDGEMTTSVDSSSVVAIDCPHQEESNETKIKSNGRLAVNLIFGALAEHIQCFIRRLRMLHHV
jgi:hypothetical protein